MSLYSATTFSCQKQITVGLVNEWRPYYFLVDDVPTGIDIDIVTLVLSELNHCATYRKMPSTTRALSELEKGNIDMLYGASYNESRAKTGYFTVPYRNEKVAIFWQKGKRRTPANFAEFVKSGMLGVVNRGSYMGEYAKQIIDNATAEQLVSVSSFEQRMQLLANGRVDYVVEDLIAGKHYLQRYPIAGVEAHSNLVFDNDVAMLFSKNSTSHDFVLQINRLLRKHQQDINAIIQQYTTINTKRKTKTKSEQLKP